MSIHTNQYYLVRDNRILFGPRRYYKPAFLKFLKLNNIDLILPDELQYPIQHLTDTHVLIHESQLDSYITTRKESVIVQEVVLIPTAVKRTVNRKRKQ
jgi:hypothetical protein